MNSLLGMDLPTPVNFVIAFVVVLLLIGAATWVVRRFGATRLDTAARSRQPRLAVVDAAAVDARRKLLIVRRDNVEHLLMIGGPTDVVVETNIVRAAAHTIRDVPPVRNGIEPQLRAPAPLADPSPWPQHPEPAPAPTISVRPERGPRMVMDDDWQEPAEPIAAPVPPVPAVPPMPSMPPAPPVRAVRAADTLASLARELSQAPVEQPPAPAPRAVHPGPAPATSPTTATPTPATHATSAPSAARPAAAMPAAAAPTPPVVPPADQSLAEMAQRLEAALRRPGAHRVPEAAARNVPVATENKPAVRQPRVGPQTKGTTNPAPQPAKNIEHEMASLLNKPGKT